MSYQIVFWSTVVWIAVCVAPLRVRSQRFDYLAITPGDLVLLSRNGDCQYRPRSGPHI